MLQPSTVVVNPFIKALAKAEDGLDSQGRQPLCYVTEALEQAKEVFHAVLCKEKGHEDLYQAASKKGSHQEEIAK